MKTGIKKIETSCNFCGSNDRELVTYGCEHEYDNTTNDIFSVVRCRDCGLYYLNPRPDVSELATIYPPNYYSYNQEKLRQEAKTDSILHKLRYKGFRAKIQKSLSLCPSKNNSLVVLDIGCGDGHTLNLYREVEGISVETHGVDFNPGAIAEASRQGHKSYLGRFEDVDLPEGYFDLVYASHVIEHVADPRQFTHKIHRLLKPGGIFWFETPNIGTADAKIFQKNNWGAYHFPRHWFFFDPDSIRKLAELTNFEIVMMDFVPNAIFWFWTFHSMIIRAHPRLRTFADWLFPPIDFQKDNLANFLRICFFCGVDVIIKLFSGQTANMVVAFRKSIK